MNAVRIALIAIAAALTGALGWMTDWGQDIVNAESSEAAKIVAKVDAASVLPDFKLGAESNAYAQIADRPLLNPTRKPAPTQAVVAVAPEPPKPQIRRGLYQLVGVADYGSVKIAQVKEVSSNKVKSVRVGDELQELRVASLDDAKLTLTFAGESEILELAKFTASGRAPQPAPPVAPLRPTPPPTVSQDASQTRAVGQPASLSRPTDTPSRSIGLAPEPTTQIPVPTSAPGAEPLDARRARRAALLDPQRPPSTPRPGLGPAAN
jgi:hypothetical protein